MKNSSDIVYESRGVFKSLWNKYTIYNDRLELEFRLFFTKIVIPKNKLIHVGVFKPPVIRTVFWAMKLDLADLYMHVGIERDFGLFKKIRFTPDNPQEFKQKIFEWLGKTSS